MRMVHQPIHVIYVLTKLELGGAQKVCLALMDGCKDHDITCSLISGNEGVLREQALRFGSVFLLEDFKREVGLRLLLKECRAFGEMVKIMRKIKREHPSVVVHTHSTKAGFFGRWAAFFAGIKPRVHTIHGFGFHNNQNVFVWLITYILELITVPITSHFVCVSHQDAKTGISLFPWFGKKYSVIRAAVDFGQFYTEKSIRICVEDHPKQPFTIGTVSCFKEQKNLFDLLQAFLLVHSSCRADGIHVKLAIIGDGHLRPAIEQWIAAHHLNQDITLLGWQQNVAPFLRTWDIFAMSSLWEGLPCAIVEARLCKLPVVCYNVGGIAEVVFDQKNGFLIEPHNWQLLAQKIESLIRNKQLLASQSLFEDNLNAFDTQTMVAMHAQLYAQLLTNR